MLRLFLNLCLLVSVFLFPWWLSVAFMGLLLITARAYEIIFWGFIIDLLYGASIPRFMNVPFVFTLGSAALFCLVEYIKPRLVFYQQ